jgi:hypothetical protein
MRPLTKQLWRPARWIIQSQLNTLDTSRASSHSRENVKRIHSKSCSTLCVYVYELLHFILLFEFCGLSAYILSFLFVYKSWSTVKPVVSNVWPLRALVWTRRYIKISASAERGIREIAVTQKSPPQSSFLCCCSPGLVPVLNQMNQVNTAHTSVLRPILIMLSCCPNSFFPPGISHVSLAFCMPHPFLLDCTHNRTKGGTVALCVLIVIFM